MDNENNEDEVVVRKSSVNTDNMIRLRKVRSTSMAEDIVTETEKQRRAQPDKPIHKPKDSLLSMSSEFRNFEGLITWAFLLLSIGGFRLFLENINKYGIRVDPAMWKSAIMENFDLSEGECPTLTLFFFANLMVITTLSMEKALAKDWISPYFCYLVHAIDLVGVLHVPVLVINTKFQYIGPGKATVICGLFLVLLLKLWSYIQVNYWCRSHLIHTDKKFRPYAKSPSLAEDFRKIEPKPIGPRKKNYDHQKIVHYPDNLYLWDIYYFWLAPTLCYELNFPMMSRIRKAFLFRGLMEVIIGTNIVLALIQQWVVPSAVNSLIPFMNLEFSKAIERVLKLAIPNHLIWLTWFYLVFHSGLNTMGEILCFADRNFYSDWWNARDILDFWKTWNLPVHRWCVRHMFKPMLRNRYPLVVAQCVVFLFSAIFHEYLISVPLRVFKIYAFLGMAMQIPLIFVSQLANKYIGRRAGNATVWISLIIGQPLAIMMYYHDFVVEHYGDEVISFYGQAAQLNITKA